MEIERLKQLIIQYKKSAEYYRNKKNSYGETECRDEYISPLLECFGWDVRNTKGKLPQYKEVIVEKLAKSKERPDYTLTLNGVSKMFVEAKKPSRDITIEIEPAMQTRSYGWNAKHAIAILTNFENLIIYDTRYKPEEGDTVDTALYRKYNYEEYMDKYQEIAKIISRDNVYSGQYDKYISSEFYNDNRFVKEIDKVFLEQINYWRYEIGNYLYENTEKYRDVKVLNDVVQDFINQIIFIRICEDRKLPLYRKLYETVKDRQVLQNVLQSVFREADRTYNSGLFSNNDTIFDLNCDIIYEMIESLYYPKIPYVFTVIEPNILGKIYESFLAESLILNNGKIELAQKKQYIYKSVVSTPVEIVRYMVKNTLEPLCNDKTPKEVLDLKIADIACGSGIFLVEVYQYLLDYCTEWYKVNDREYLLQVDGNNEKLPLSDKKEILTSCIYGIDIDVHAVEVSKFSLYLKLMEDENEPSVRDGIPILPELDKNIKCGNSLVANKDIEELKLTSEELVSIVPFDWDEINEGNKFDVIIGNPPYVKTEDIKKIHTSAEQKVYKKYASAYKQYDKYYLFIEKAMNLLSKNGLMCYIVPNKFIHVESAEKIRVMLKDDIIKLDDFGPVQLFEDKTIYSSIVTIGGKKTEHLSYRQVESVLDLWDEKVTKYTRIAKKQLNCTPWDDTIDYNDTSPWLLSSDKEYNEIIGNVKDKIVPLSKNVDIYTGIQTSRERVYKIEGKTIVSDDDEYVKFIENGKEYKIERDILRLYFKPSKKEQGKLNKYSDINQVEINYNIFPYDYKGEFITKDIMEEKYPNAWKYLLEHKENLMPKSLGGTRDVLPKITNIDEWYRYGRSQAITKFNNNNKIIVGVSRRKDEPLYLIDRNNYLIASGGTAGYVGISLRENSKYDLEYVHAWLSHTITDRYLQMIGSDFEGGFIARNTYTLPKLPFIELDFKDIKQKELHDNVVSCTRDIRRINEELSYNADKVSKIVLEKEKNRLIKKIEDMITKVYQQDF